MSRIEKILEMLKSMGSDSFLEHALALEYVKIGNDEAAKASFESLLQKNPDYLGSYYHLGKLYERIGFQEKAIETYEKGMAVAKNVKDNHSYNELRGALDEL
jgi:Tfp pilus assembly protein PilF